MFKPVGRIAFWLIGDLASDHVRELAIDGRGRVWMGAEWGLTVLDGEEWRRFRMDNADLGDNDITGLAVVQGGSPMANPEATTSGSLMGRMVLEDGETIAGARVEVCVEGLARGRYKETPCSDQALVRGAEIDGEGNFIIIDLPAGYYAVTVDTGDGWAELKTEWGISAARARVGPGEETNLGEIVFEAAE